MDNITAKEVDKNQLRDYIGDAYFDYLLNGFSVNRNFEEAQRYAGYLAAPAFHGYNYRETAIRISNQLKEGKILYNSYPFPDARKCKGIKTNCPKNIHRKKSRKRPTEKDYRRF
jgi:hypothetical protein